MEDKFLLGAIDSPVDLRDYDYSMVSGSSEKIEVPESFELDYDIPIQNQGSIGSCVAHALMEMKSYIDNNMYSIGFLYGNRSDTDHQESGLVPRQALKNLVKYGDCFKESFDYNIEYPDVRNKMSEIGTDKLLTEAAGHKSLAYVSLNSDEIKEYLVKYKKPIMIVVRVYQNFYNAKSNKGIIPSEPVGAYKGNHAMVITGYKKDMIKIVNSWGNTGDNGYYYLDINSSIIKELWALEDEKNVNRPLKKKYTVGWNKDSKGWWYSPDGLTYYQSDWKQLNGNWFRFDSEGYAYQNCWFKYPKDNKWYYFDDNCYMVSNKWIIDNGKWYRLGPDGAMLIGWFQDADGLWYYLDIDKGYMYSNCRILIDGKYYSFDSHGHWIENEEGAVSEQAIDFIKSWEGFYSEPYYDCVGVKTLGYGMTGEEIRGLDYVTEEQATSMLKDWINRKYAPVIKNDLDARGIILKQCEFDALVSFAYNCGTSKTNGLLGSTLYRNICNGVRDPETITANFQAWSNGGGKRIEGLYRRRTKEASMFLYGDYTGNN
ncbi:glycoside hydrolase family protein [Clostridium butyricum]|uniref:glycoside hydrolase family protein n=2 Tax=Clostridium butyricum TaxID=1492 RepID=UPI003D15FD54